jgi:hypothetical protein
MTKTLPTFRYLFKAFSRQTLIGFLISLGNLAIVDLVFFLTDRAYGAHQVIPLAVPFEMADGIFVFIISLVLFVSHFKVALANGVSRKTFLLANLPAAILVAAALSIFNLIVVQVHNLFWPVFFYSEVFYPQTHWAGLLILQFGLYLLLIGSGWFITLAYYRSSTPVKWAISLAPFVLAGLMSVVNAWARGVIFTSIGQYFRWSTVDPYRAAASWLIYAAILGGLVYLLLRRAPLKD